MTDEEHDRWVNGQIKAEFKKNAKDHLKEKFNKQDQDRIHENNINQLQKEYIQLQKTMHEEPKQTYKFQPRKGHLGKIRNDIHKNEMMRRKKEIEERRQLIKKEIKHRQQEMRKNKEKEKDTERDR